MFDLLRGLKVVDLTTIVLGPYATQILGDLGAEVVKVESPEGDLFRAVRPGRQPDVGVQFQNFNRNKRAVCIDLKSEAGQGVLQRLVAGADVVVHNMRSRSAKALGADFEALREINPHLVYCYAAGFGDAGPDRDAPAYDDIIQARSGLAALNAGSDGEPRFVPSIVCDKVVGLHLAIAVLAGVTRQRAAGGALCIEAPMLETMTSFLLSEHLAGQTLVPAEGGYGYARLTSPNRRPYRTRDGHLAILPYSTRHWQRFFRAAGREDLADDPRVTDSERRSLHIDELYEEIAKLALTRSSIEWLEILKAEDVPCARVNALEELELDPHLQAVGFFDELEDDTLGTYRQLRSPFRVSNGISGANDGNGGNGANVESGRRAPRLGEHSVEVLAEAGYTPDAIDALLADGVVVGR